MNGLIDRHHPRVNNPKPYSAITREGYYFAVIVSGRLRDRNGSRNLELGLEIDRGNYRGFRLRTHLYDNKNGRIRLGHLCRAVGVKGKLRSLDQLIGRTVKIHVVPDRGEHHGRSYLKHRITKFFPANGNGRRAGPPEDL